MKVWKMFLAFLLMALLCIGIVELPVFAASVSQDGLKVTMTTEKEAYNQNEKIVAILTVTNTNDIAVNHVLLETLAPEGYKLDADSTSVKQVESLRASEAVTLKVRYTKKVPVGQEDYSGIDDRSKISNKPDINRITINSNSGTSPKTGDGGNDALWITLFVLAGSGIVVMLVLKKNAGRKFLSLILCVTMSGSLLMQSPFTAEAAEENDTGSIIAETVVKVEGRQIMIQGIVTYNLPENFPENLPENLPSEKNEVTVTFKIRDEGQPDPGRIILNSGEYVSAPAIHKNEGYQFAGWFLDPYEKDWTNSFNFGKTPIRRDTTLYALWVDVITDTDGDQLADELEAYAHTNLTEPDTDSDGLTDYEEVVLLGTDPLTANIEGDTDPDQDNLLSIDEIRIYGTNPNSSDSDGDGLNDYDEIKSHLTNPMKFDSDDDGAGDGWEVAHSYNPNKYNDNFEVTVFADEPTDIIPVTAGVVADVEGRAVTSLAVRPTGASDDVRISAAIPGYMGHAYEFSADGSVYRAILEFRFQEPADASPASFCPRIYYFNESEGTLEELPDQEVGTNVVRAKVSHFSTYLLLNKIEFDKIWETEIKSPITASGGKPSSSIDVVFVTDVSGSMSGNSIATTKVAINTFLDALSENDRAGLITFNSSATVKCELTTDKQTVKNESAAMRASGMTSLYSGLIKAVGMLTKPKNNYGYKMIIALTDGRDEPSASYNNYYEKVVKQAADENIVIYTIGVGSTYEVEKLKTIANNTGGAYYKASVSSQITDVFEQIQRDTIDVSTDTNNDHIPDYFNDMLRDGKLTVGTGVACFTGIDFNYGSDGITPSSDWDGDGVLNGDELVVTYQESTGRVYVKMVSDPTMVHSDADKIDDGEEHRRGSDPIRNQVVGYNASSLTDDGNYLYMVYVKDYDESLLYQFNSAFLATVFGVWNLEELCRDLYIDYFVNYVKPVNQNEEKEARAVIVQNLDKSLGILSNLKGFADKAKDILTLYGDVKNLISIANGYTTNLEQLIVMYRNIVERVVVYSPEAKTITLITRTIKERNLMVITSHAPLTNSKISGVELAFDIIDGAFDMADTISALAKVNVNAALFEENIDILQQMRNYPTRAMAGDAANKLINLMGEGYGKAIASALAQDAGEMTLNVLFTIAAFNPYVAALKFIRDAIDTVTVISKEKRLEYEMLGYDCLGCAINSLLLRVTDRDGTYWYYDSDSLPYYLTTLAQLRILGEKKYGDFYTTGMNGWINDKKLTNQMVQQSIENVRRIANVLDLKISSKL